jgi:pimeloyl-ACP methyl ester carboxylesterase
MKDEVPPVALVHGWGGSFAGTYGQTGWEAALRAAGRIVIAPDLPGHGHAPASHDPADYADLASDLDAMLPPGPLDAVGFSLGGKLVLELASRSPSRFRRIVIGGLGDNIYAAELGQTIAVELERGLPADARQRMPVLAKYIDESPSDLLSLVAVNRRPANPKADPARLQRIQSQLLLINGDADMVAHPDAGLRAALPHAQYLALPDVDHFTMHWQAAFREAAVRFLGSR